MWERFRQRKIVQWTLGYAAGAWLLLQLLSLLAQPFSWPDSVVRTATILLAAGLLIVIVLAWFHGERGRQRASASEVLLLAALLILTGIGVWWTRTRFSPAPQSAPAAGAAAPSLSAPMIDQRSVAVLPFADLSATRDQEYFSDGMAEALINALSRVDGLRVAARTSAFAFKGKAVGIKGIADSLRVAHVLEGSVSKVGNRLRVNAQLIKAADGYNVWSQTYDRDLSNIFAVQDEISRAIVEALKVQLLDRADAPLVAQATANLEAYDLYLKGRHFWNKRTAASLRQAIAYFEAALVKDPNYAPAYAALAVTYVLLPGYGTSISLSDAFAQARQAAGKALVMDSTLAEAYMALGFTGLNYGDNLVEAERNLRKGFELSPRYSTAHQWYGEYLIAVGRTTDAIGKHQEALRLDPLSLILNTELGRVYYFSRDYDRAVAQLRSTIELDPSFPRAHGFLAMTYTQQGRYDQAIDEFQRAIALAGGSLYTRWGLAALGYAYGRAGRPDQARQVLAQLLEQQRAQHLSHDLIAIVYLGLGDQENALQWMEKGAAHRTLPLQNLSADPILDPLRSDPRFVRILTSSRKGVGR